MTISPDAAPLVAQALSDPATRTGTSANVWTVIGVESKQWPDASLGCPKPGVMYIQVVTPGYLITHEFARKSSKRERGPHSTGLSDWKDDR